MPPLGELPTIAVVIPTFNHARFLAEAIESVLAQTRKADEIIVVDDGSTDDPAAVVARFQNVRLIRQENRGLSGARNTGLRNCTASHVIFLDADDRLLPTAIEAGLTCIAGHPESAFVYGGYRLVSEDGRPLSPDIVRLFNGDAYLKLLQQYIVGAIMAVLYRRDCLLAMNGFDETLRRCEDYDLNLRIAQRYPIASHPAVIAEYRKHGQTLSNNLVEMLKTTLMVLDRHETEAAAPPVRAALQEGRAHYRSLYVSRMLDSASARWRADHDIKALATDLLRAAQWSPFFTIRKLLGVFARRVLPRPFIQWIGRIRGKPNLIPTGAVRFGDLKRLSPISDRFGFDRGTPLDRYYIRKFLAKHAIDIRGDVLELGSNFYTQHYGGTRVQRSVVLSIEANNPHATIVGDLAQSNTLPESAFDCIVLTQALQFIFDVRAALATVYSALKPGGILLVTTPGVSKMHDSWPWYWTFTRAAVCDLLQNQFGHDAVSAEAHGNVFVATAFLYGLSAEELDISDLDANDPSYPVVVTARAVKREDA